MASCHYLYCSVSKAFTLWAWATINTANHPQTLRDWGIAVTHSLASLLISRLRAAQKKRNREIESGLRSMPRGSSIHCTFLITELLHFLHFPSPPLRAHCWCWASTSATAGEHFTTGAALNRIHQPGTVSLNITMKGNSKLMWSYSFTKWKLKEHYRLLYLGKWNQPFPEFKMCVSNVKGPSLVR